MKKVLVAGVFAFFGVIALSSCKKEYTCDCVDANGTETTEVHKGKDADDACADGSSVFEAKVCAPA